MPKLSKSEPTYPHSILMQESKDMREKNIEPEFARFQMQDLETRYVLSIYQYIPFYEPDSEVCTGYILLTSSMYFKTYISYQYVQVCTLYILGTYLQKKV